MSGNNLSVKVTADVVDLQSKFAIAKAEVSGLSSELNKLARSSAQGVIDPAASARLQQVSGDFLVAKNRLAELRAQMAATRETSSGLGTTLHGISTSISSAFEVAGITAAAAAVMKVGDAVTELGERAIQIRSMSEILGVTTSQFQAMSVASEESGTSVEVFARASEKLTNFLTEARNGSGKAVEQLHQLGVTTADIANPTFQLNDLLAVLKSRLEDTSTAEATRKALLQDLGARTALAIEAIKEYDGSQKGVEDSMKRVNGLSGEQIDRLKHMKTAWSELTTGISNASSKVLAFAGDMLERYKAAVLEKHPEMNPALTPSGPGRSTSSTGIQQAAAERARDEEALRNQSLQDDMAKIKEGVAAFAEGTAERLAMLRRYAAEAKQYYGSGNVDEVRKANQEVLAAEREYRATQSREALAAAKEQVQALGANTSLSLAQRLDAERAIWTAVLSGDRVVGQQRVEAAREFSREYTDIARQTAAQTAAIARSDVSTDISIAKIELAAKRSALDEEVQENRISAAQKLKILRDLATQEYELDLKGLDSELKGLQQGTVEYERVYNQIRELKAKLNADLMGLDTQYQRDLARQLREQTTIWKSAVGEIENAEGTLVTNVLTGRRTLGQSIIQISGQVVTQEIANDVKAYTTKVLLQNQEKALEQGGYLYHLLFSQKDVVTNQAAEAAKTAAVTTGAAARQAAAATSATAAQVEASSINSAIVMSDAAVAAAGAFAATAAIPLVGPELAPAAAAAAYSETAAFAPLASLDVGTNYVPQDMVAQIHKGEAIVPKQYNPAAGGDAGRGGRGSRSQGGIHIHAKMNDLRGLTRSLQQGGALEKALREVHRRGGH